MKRLVITSIVCSALSAGSFVVLLLEDRRLGVPFPYSIPLAFMSMVVLAPALFALVERLRANRPIVVRDAPRPVAPVEGVGAAAGASEAIPPRVPPGRTAGVVLLDFSSVAQCREPGA